MRRVDFCQQKASFIETNWLVQRVRSLRDSAHMLSNLDPQSFVVCDYDSVIHVSGNCEWSSRNDINFYICIFPESISIVLTGDISVSH